MVENNKKDGLSRLESENERLRAAVEELSILNDISTAINSTLSLEQIIELIVKKCIKHLKVEQGTVTLLESQEQDNPFKTMIRKADRSHDFLPLHLDTQITGYMLVNQKPILINDMQNNEYFRIPISDDNPIVTLLSVPLMLKGKVIGSLNVFNKKDAQGFSETDKRLLSIIATQSAQVIENARLYEEEQSLIHLREEMSMAFKIQTGLLPKEHPQIEGYDIAGKSIPAKAVGGDYFDFIDLGDGRLVSCLGDVSGKGMPAALLMSNLQATFRGQDLGDRSPAEIMRRSNILLFRSTEPDRFATFFFGILDSAKHEFSYCNAGHNYPVLVSGDDRFRHLELSGLLLGALEESQYRDESIPLNTGDTLLVFSDGISEAINEAGDEFGEQRIPEIVIRNRGSSALELIDSIIREVMTFSKGLAQRDDMTVVAIKRTS